MLFLTTFVTVTMFISSFIISKSLSTGVSDAKNKLGADAVITAKLDSDVEATLFDGVPSTLKMPVDIYYTLKDEPYVTDIVSRIYLATLAGLSCCSGEVQLIVTDIHEDFLLKSWMSDVPTLGKNEIIVGHDFAINIGNYIKYYNREYKVVGKLSQTGTGYDKSAFISYKSAADILSDPMYADLFSDVDIDTFSSMVFVNSSSPATIKKDIQNSLQEYDIDIYNMSSKMASFVDAASSVKTVAVMLTTMLLVLYIIAMTTITVISSINRRAEIGSMIVVGFRPTHIFRLFLLENTIINFAACVASMFITEIVFRIYAVGIKNAFHMPMIQLPLTTKVIFYIGIILMTLLITIISILVSLKTVLGESNSELIRQVN